MTKWRAFTVKFHVGNINLGTDHCGNDEAYDNEMKISLLIINSYIVLYYDMVREWWLSRGMDG